MGSDLTIPSTLKFFRLITSSLGLVWLHSNPPNPYGLGGIEVGNELIFLSNKPLCGVEHHVLAYYVSKIEFSIL
jgi:hypothetical protein